MIEDLDDGIRRCAGCGREITTMADVLCDSCHDPHTKDARAAVVTLLGDELCDAFDEAERDRDLETQARLREEDRDAEIQAELHSFWYGWPSGGGIIS